MCTLVEVGAAHNKWVEVALERIEDIPAEGSLAEGTLVEDSLHRTHTSPGQDSGGQRLGDTVISYTQTRATGKPKDTRIFITKLQIMGPWEQLT